MSYPSYPGLVGPHGLESHGSPLSERNFPCGTPILVSGRYSQPDMRYWDSSASFFPGLGTYGDFLEQVGDYEVIAPCDVAQITEVPNTSQPENLYDSLQGNINYVSGDVYLYQKSVPSSAQLESQPPPEMSSPSQSQALPSRSPPQLLPPPPAEFEVTVETIQEQLQGSTCQSIGVFEEITHARCIDCDEVVDSRETTHNNASCRILKNHGCPVCGIRFNLEQNLDVHKIVQHSSKDEYVPFTECSYCSNRRKRKTFQRFFAYIAHMKSHYKPDQYFCPSCADEFPYLTLFQRHVRLVHDATASVDDRDKPPGFSSELGYCPHCCSLVPLDQVEKHRLLHQIHLKLQRERRVPFWKRNVKDTTVPDDPTPSEPNEITNKRKCNVPPRPPKVTHKCDVCSKIFRRPAELKRHSVIHSADAKKWECPMCDSKFSHKSGLEGHKKATHGDPQGVSVTCKICSQRFAKQSNLNRHIKKQHPIKIDKIVLDCPECTCVFSSHRTLTRHRREVHDTVFLPSFCCSVCSRTFLRDGQLRRHMLVHNSKDALKPFPCTRCYKRFNLKSTLKLHMDIHARKDVDDPFLTHPKCPICMKQLSSRNALRKHMSVHERNYECCVCFQKFSTLHRLDKHRCVPHTVLPEEVSGQLTELSSNTRRQSLEVHQPTKNYECNLCSNSFYSFRAYKEHCSQHQGLRPHLCWTCHKSFRTIELLELHKEVHNRAPIYCEYCPAVLQGRSQYTQHVQAKHRPESGVTKHTGVDMSDRAAAAMSVQFPEFTGRELAEGLFRTRAQSVDHNELDCTGGQDDFLVPTDRPVRCQVCKHLYDSITHLVNHWMNCGLDRDHSFCVISCPLCSRSLTGASDGVQHMKEYHAHILSAIEKIKDPSEPRDHEETAATENDDNDEDFVLGRPLKKRRRVVRRRARICHYCKARFAKPSDLIRHIRIHTDERPYSCETCGRAFRVTSALNAHVLTHTRTKAEHACTVCSSEFFSKSALALHMRLHNGEKPLKCRGCDETFRTSCDRRNHEITWHGAPGGHVCKRIPCRHCSAAKRRRMRAQRQLETSTESPTAPLLGPPVSKSVLPVKQVAVVQDKIASNEIQPQQFVATAAQITSLSAQPIKLSAGSAFGPLSISSAPAQPEVEFFITARRISHTEYSVTFSKTKPRSIRNKVDTTISLTASLLLDSASKNSSILLTLSDSQILSISCSGVVKSLQSCDSVVMRARPADPSCPSIVELLEPPEVVEFVKRCEVCEVDLLTREASDAHFSSEDHEIAQLNFPLPTAVHNAIDHSVMPAATVPLQRKDDRTDFTCKLCGRKFLDMEPLVAHIRLEHERDHPQGITRPAARTAPIR